MKLTNFILLMTVVAMVSCKTQQAVGYSNYLEHMADTTVQRLAIQEPVIKKNDLLSIKVYSASARPDITDAPYNLPEQTVIGSNTASATAGFLVDQYGNIDYPRLGSLHVEGLTKVDVAEMIRKRLEAELKSPSVIVRFLNYRVTILGEVRTPGTFTLPTERITVLEALGFAGDITDFGNKNQVRVAREKDGAVEIGYIDLTSRNLFLSPYYRLQQNDVVFVEQNKRKFEQQEQILTAQRVGIFTGIASTLAIILNVIIR